MQVGNYSTLLAIISLIMLHLYILASDKWINMNNVEKIMFVTATLFGVASLVTQIIKLNPRSGQIGAPQAGPAQTYDTGFM